MLIFRKPAVFLLAACVLTAVHQLQPSSAQSIKPALDGTGTRINQSGNDITIFGGSSSADGANLFHSFQKFNLSQVQIATFLANPALRNIFGRVNGNQISVIDGLIRVTGGNPNLLLMNPAGVVFGPNARLEVPANFLVTTATRVGFGSDRWFSAFGSNDYNKLVGEPEAFVLDSLKSGSIINAGQLSVPFGSSLTLLGSSVINTGQLTAPGGSVTIAAVPGTNRVRISQPGHVLSLEIDIPTTTDAQLPAAADVPDLITTGNSGIQTGLIVDPDRSVKLASSGTSVPTQPGTAISSGEISVASATGIGGTVNLFGERVGLLQGQINASGESGGGTIRIGGDAQGKGPTPNALRTLISNNTVIDASALQQGNGGKVVIWSDQTTGFYGQISAHGGKVSGNGGVVEVSARENLIFRGQADVSAVNGQFGTLLLDPTNITIVSGSNAQNDNALASGNILTTDSPTSDFTISEAALENLAATANVTLQASNNITLSKLTDGVLSLPVTFGGSVTFQAGGTFAMDPTDKITTQGGSLTISGTTLRLGQIDVSPTIQLIGDNIEFLGGANSIRASRQTSAGTNSRYSNTLSIQTLTPGRSISIVSPTLVPNNLNLSNLQFIGGGIDSLTIGGFNNTGNINIAGNIALDSSLGLSANAIAITGGISTSSLSLTADTITPGSFQNVRTNSVSLSPSSLNWSTFIGGDVPTPQTLNITKADLQALASNNSQLSSLSFSSSGSGILSIQAPLTSNSLSLQGRKIEILAGPNSVHTNSISFETGFVNQDIIIGGAAGNPSDNTLYISDRELQAIRPIASQFSQFTVLGGTGTLTTQPSGVLSPGNPLIADTINLTSDEINLLSGPGSLRTNNLQLGISFFGTQAQNIIVGGGADTGAATLDLTQQDLQAITPLQNNQFSSIRISGSTGNLTVLTPLVASNSASLQSDAIDLNSGPASIRANTVNLSTGSSARNVQLGGTVKNANSLSLTDTDLAAIVLQSSPQTFTFNGVTFTIPGNPPHLSISTSNGIVTVANPVSLNNSLSLTGGQIQVAQPLTVNGDLTFSAATLTASSDVTATGGITFGGSLNVDRNARFTAGKGISFPGAITGTGDLVLSANTALALGSITTQGTSVTLLTNQPLTLTSSVFTNGGNFTISSPSTLIVSAPIQTTGGAITLNGTGINTAAITLDSSNPAGQGGNIRLTANPDSVVTGDINASGLSGGAVTINAIQSITAGNINTSGSVGNGGNVTLDPIGNIQVATINAQGGNNGTGGTVSISTQRFLQVLSSFSDSNGVNASISTAGGLGGGAITIQHGGGLLDVPFTVGNAQFNGTAGGITSGATNTISPIRAFPSSFSQGKISIQTQPPPTCPPICKLDNLKQPQALEDLYTGLEELFTAEFEQYLGVRGTRIKTLSETRRALQEAEDKTGVRSALVYVFFKSTLAGSSTAEQALWELSRQGQSIDTFGKRQVGSDQKVNDADQLQILIITADRDVPIYRVISNASFSEVTKQVENFVDSLNLEKATKPEELQQNFDASRQLYSWLITPLEKAFEDYKLNVRTSIEKPKINNLIFVMDKNLRSLPIAALHEKAIVPYDTNHPATTNYLIEKYSIGLMPSVSLTNTDYQAVGAKDKIIAMGRSKFEGGESELHLVATQLEQIRSISVDKERVITNLDDKTHLIDSSKFRKDLLVSLLTQEPKIIHLDTHASLIGDVNNDYISMSEPQKLLLRDFRTLLVNVKSLELLVLSACNTAVDAGQNNSGPNNVELGFAGVAVQTGTKSVIGSLWSIDESGTLALLTTFYSKYLQVVKEGEKATAKTQALQKAQLALLHCEVKIQENELVIPGLPSIRLPNVVHPYGSSCPKPGEHFDHPYYWGGLTLVGNPW